jgi:1,4-dihydroxy-2-naphthoyl-CoA hydrolase
MSIWLQKVTVQDLNRLSEDTMVSHIGIEFTEIGEDHICAKMPVDQHTHQPDGLLHGGASVVLAETLGSIAANLCIDRNMKICVGLDINANHIRPVRTGYVTGVTKPIHLGASTQIWEIQIKNEKNSLVCIARLTMAVLDKNST